MIHQRRKIFRKRFCALWTGATLAAAPYALVHGDTNGTEALLGDWAGYYVGPGNQFRSGIWFTLDEVSGGAARGRVTRTLDGAMHAQRLACDRAPVSMRSMGNGVVELGFGGALCQGSGELAPDGDALAGTMGFGGTNVKVVFSRP